MRPDQIMKFTADWKSNRFAEVAVVKKHNNLVLINDNFVKFLDQLTIVAVRLTTVS